jgi:hypothetical protein
MPRGDASRLPKGRPKGCKNKFTTLKEDYLEAYKQKGGVQFLMSLNQDLFLRGLIRLIPQEVKADIRGEIKTRSIVELIQEGYKVTQEAKDNIRH